MENLTQFVIKGDNQKAAEAAQFLLEGGTSPEAILKEALIPAMDEVGRMFQEGEFFIPEMLLSARAMKGAMEILKPSLVDSGIEPVGKVVICTVKGDLHDIGKTLVGMAFEGAGFEVIDLGCDCDDEKILAAIKEHRPLAVGLSALLTTTMQNMKGVVEAIESAGLRDQIKIMVGGAPLTESYAEQIGADFYGLDPATGKEYLKAIVG